MHSRQACARRLGSRYPKPSTRKPGSGCRVGGGLIARDLLVAGKQCKLWGAIICIMVVDCLWCHALQLVGVQARSLTPAREYAACNACRSSAITVLSMAGKGTCRSAKSNVLSNHFRLSARPALQIACVGHPAQNSRQVVIVDEAHFIKNSQTRRAQARVQSSGGSKKMSRTVGLEACTPLLAWLCRRRGVFGR